MLFGVRNHNGVRLMKCSNCDKEYDPSNCLMVLHRMVVVAAACSECTERVLVEKVVLRRSDPQAMFEFEGLLPAETAKG